MKKNTACTILICTALVVLTTLAFHSLIQNDFVNYDDDLYVTNNPHVLSGLNPKSVTWAFTTFHTGNYHPITWLSHMLDCTIFGLTPAAHHTVSLIIHIVNAVLLFLILNKITGSLWPVLLPPHSLHCIRSASNQSPGPPKEKTFLAPLLPYSQSAHTFSIRPSPQS